MDTLSVVNYAITAGIVFGSVVLAQLTVIRVIGPKIKDNIIGSVQEMLGLKQSEHMREIGAIGNDKRLEHSLARAAGEDILAQANPMLNMALGALPSVKKWIMQDPQTRLPIALAMADKFMPMISGMADQTTTTVGSKVASTVLDRLRLGQ